MNLQKEIPVRLLIITPSLACGGSEKFVSLLCRHINTSKFSVCLVVVNNARPFYAIDNPAVKIVDLGKERVLFSLPAIKKIVREFKPDIIFSTASHLNLYLAIFKNQFSKSIQFIAREASIVSINSSQAKMPLLYKKLVKKFYRRFDLIICQSGYMKQDLETNYNIGARKAVVIYNATGQVPDVAINPLQKTGKERYKFLTVARLSEEKGIGRLIHAAGLLSLPFVYYIIGEGPERKKLEQLISELQLGDKIILAGQKDDPFSGMEDADLFLMGSYYEGFPNAMLEAGACGIPTIAFNVPGGIAEITRANENGILVEDNDIIGFAREIKNALDMHFDRDKIRKDTMDRFSVSRMMNELENIFLKFAPNK